jgi:hypothetical protein
MLGSGEDIVTLSSLIASRALGGGADMSSEATASGLSRLLEPGVARLKVSLITKCMIMMCELT